MNLINKIKTSYTAVFLAIVGWGELLIYLLSDEFFFFSIFLLFWFCVSVVIAVLEWVFQWKINNRFYIKYLSQSKLWLVFLIGGILLAILPVIYMLCAMAIYKLK